MASRQAKEKSMRFMHPLAIIGLVLNILPVFFLFGMMSGADLTELDPAQKEMVEAVLSFKPLYYVSLALQVGGMWLISQRNSIGIWVASAGAVVMFPIGMIFLLGCLLSNANMKYGEFARSPVLIGREGHFTFRYQQEFMYITALNGGLIFFGLFLGFGAYLPVFLVAGGLFLYLWLRIKDQSPLVVVADGLYVLPTVLSTHIFLPYADLISATLYQDKTINFLLKTPQGNKELTWSLQTIVPHQQKQALEELATALRRHDVVLL